MDCYFKYLQEMGGSKTLKIYEKKASFWLKRPLNILKAKEMQKSNQMRQFQGWVSQT